MAICNKCGREIPRKTGVFKVMKTGKYTGGSDYYRNVNLCDKCAELVESEATNQQKTRTMLIMVVGVLVVGAVIYYIMFMR